VRESVQESVTRLLRLQRAPREVARAFRNWTHNAQLLPKLQKQLEMILDAYGKFESVVYDCQGIRDDGSDIVLRFGPSQNEQDNVLGFQVKSFSDLEKKNYMQEIKAQHSDSIRKVIGLQHYYILLCTDPTQHVDKIRNIEAEFRSAGKTEIIEPGYAYNFLHHPKTRVDALIKRMMENEDYVLKRAWEFLDFDTPTARALAVYLSVRYVFSGNREIAHSDLLASQGLRRVYDELREKQALLIEESLDDAERGRLGSDEGSNDEEDDDSRYQNEPIVELDQFEPQLAHDLDRGIEQQLSDSARSIASTECCGFRCLGQARIRSR
jgi:hypothetical protein